MNTRVNIRTLREILEATPASQNIMLVGKHGIGKSRILEEFFVGKGCRVVPLFLGQMSDPGDIIGIPHKDEATGKTEFLPPYWFPTDKTPVVLFLDELNRARPEVLQTVMDLALNRKLAGKALPDGSRIISAVNSGDEYQLTELDPALVSRFNVYEFAPGADEWLAWATANGVDERILSFITARKDMLDGDDSNGGTGGAGSDLYKSPDRRAWERLSDIIKGVPCLSDVHKVIAGGIIGQKAASGFFDFISKSRIIPAEELLTGDFGNSLRKLSEYGTPELAVINDSVFMYLEKHSDDADKLTRMSENLSLYYGYLKQNGLREAMAHFANMFAGTNYPNALAFIVSECGGLFSEVTGFVASLREAV